MKLISKLVLIALICCVTTAGAAGINVDEKIAESEKLAIEKKYSEAIKALEEAEKQASGADLARIHEARGSVYKASGDLVIAIDEYEQAVSLWDGDACARLGQALFYESIGEPGVALSNAELTLEAGCEQPELMLLRGRLFMWQDDPIDAIDYFYEAINDSNQRAETLREVGGAYVMLGFPDVAAAYLEEALKSEEDDSDAHSLLADAYSMTGRFEKSLEQYRRAIAIDPNSFIAGNNYGYTLFMMGKPDEALAVFNDLNKEKPTPYSLCNVMEVNVFKGKYDEAQSAGRRCVEEIGKSPGLSNFERYYMNSAARAVKLLHEDRQALHPMTQMDLARQYLKDSDPTNALAAVLVVLMMEPKNIDALMEAGRLYSLLGDVSKSGSFLNLVIGLSGNDRMTAGEARRILTQNAYLSFGNMNSSPVWYQSAKKK
ncbi:MAG: tetratricopeptide repeat protein [bacterium]